MINFLENVRYFNDEMSDDFAVKNNYPMPEILEIN